MKGIGSIPRPALIAAAVLGVAVIAFVVLRSVGGGYWDGGDYGDQAVFTWASVVDEGDIRVTKAAHDELAECGYGDDYDELKRAVDDHGGGGQKQTFTFTPGEEQEPQASSELQEIGTGVWEFKCGSE
jgi:hypothetical protein